MIGEGYFSSKIVFAFEALIRLDGIFSCSIALFCRFGPQRDEDCDIQSFYCTVN